MGQSTPINPRKGLSWKVCEGGSSFEEPNYLEDQAWRLPPGPERDAMLKRARQMDVANHTSEWLSSPGLQPPK
jgi:hypothetical protein